MLKKTIWFIESHFPILKMKKVMKILKDRIHVHRGKKREIDRWNTFNKSLLETIQCTTLSYEIKLLKDFIGDICQISLFCIDEKDLNGTNKKWMFREQSRISGSWFSYFIALMLKLGKMYWMLMHACTLCEFFFRF